MFTWPEGADEWYDIKRAKRPKTTIYLHEWLIIFSVVSIVVFLCF